MKLFTYIILLILFMTTCSAPYYFGFIYDYDTLKPVDSVLVTTNMDVFKNWPKSDWPDSKSDCYAISDSGGYFSFACNEKKDESLTIFYMKEGYVTGRCSDEILPGDTFFIFPDTELRKAREEERWKTVTTITQFPLSSGDTIFIVNEEETIVYVNDTTIEPFINRTWIYIDPDKKSKHYDEFINFNLDEDRYRSIPIMFKHKIPESLPLRWVPLDEYKGEYFLYSSLINGIIRYEITDTILISYGSMDGDYGFAYDGVEKINKEHHIIKNVFREGFYTPDEMHIYIIDRNKGIAVFEEYENGKVTQQSLYVDARKARNFPLIVHGYQGDIMPNYYPLDTTDFDQLLLRFKIKK